MRLAFIAPMVFSFSALANFTPLTPPMCITKNEMYSEGYTYPSPHVGVAHVYDSNGNKISKAAANSRVGWYGTVRHMGVVGNGNLEIDRGVYYDIDTWDAGLYTGLTGTPQVGRYNLGAASASNAYQVGCHKVGALVNTKSFTTPKVMGGGPNIFFGYRFPDLTTSPWAKGEDLVVQSTLRIPTNYISRGNPVTQIVYQILLRDTTTGATLHYLVVLYDNRGLYNFGIDNIHVVEGGFGSEPAIATTIHDNAKYSTRIYSENPVAQTYDVAKFLRVHITATDLEEAVADYNALPNAKTKVSTDAKDYVVTLAGLFTEYAYVEEQGSYKNGSYVPAGDVASGFSADHIGIYSYKPN